MLWVSNSRLSRGLFVIKSLFVSREVFDGLRQRRCLIDFVARVARYIEMGLGIPSSSTIGVCPVTWKFWMELYALGHNVFLCQHC